MHNRKDEPPAFTQHPLHSCHHPIQIVYIRHPKVAYSQVEHLPIQRTRQGRVLVHILYAKRLLLLPPPALFKLSARNIYGNYPPPTPRKLPRHPPLPGSQIQYALAVQVTNHPQ
jgi:hypothetical protein